MINAVTISGTRHPGLPLPSITRLFETFIGPWADQRTRFFLGGAVGIDTLALEWLAWHTDSAITVVVPKRLADQPVDAAKAVADVEAAGRCAVIELDGPRWNSRTFHIRNEWMVNRSGLVIGFPDQLDWANDVGGTYQCLRYAESRGVPTLVKQIP